MQLFTPTTSLPSRLALVLAILTYGTSAAPHPHTKRCHTVGGDPCYAAADCCAFSYCQAIDYSDGNPPGPGVCSPAFSEVPYMKIVTPAEFVMPVNPNLKCSGFADWLFGC
ncbi:hypothetical protein FIBSPDRAFT_879226 [Athelia psychrophila]|uniref:Hydrophobin n=1 Tax=Athelia psychrophila TaxID=1759441 RepID=A0A167U8F1_9AGAM|nr:hypothetical protein FIBSPDRAFT_879226 [Fibularhizoctonia sp. CBS 109695]